MVQTVEMEERAERYHDFQARKKFKSNGDGYSPNESKLLGQIVVFRAGKPKDGIVPIRAIGKLRYVRARTRGNTTLGVAWKSPSSTGKIGRREEVLWAFRDQEAFTIESFNPSNPRLDEAAWIARREATFPAADEVTGV